MEKLTVKRVHQQRLVVSLVKGQWFWAGFFFFCVGKVWKHVLYCGICLSASPLPDGFWLLKSSMPNWLVVMVSEHPSVPNVYLYLHTDFYRKNLEAWIWSEMIWHLPGKGISSFHGPSLWCVQIALQLPVSHLAVKWAKPFAFNYHFDFRSRQYTHALIWYWMVNFAFSIFAKWQPLCFRINS